MSSPPLLRVSELQAQFVTGRGTQRVKAVDGVSFELREGQTLGLVGESGSGKTTTVQAILRMLPPGGSIVGGTVEYRGTDLMKLSARDMRRIRGAEIAMILQDPMASLDPLFSIFDQVAEPARRHQRLVGAALLSEATALLKSMQIPSPEQRLRNFPHQLSGGMRQRVVGAIALAGRPKVIIADEPTTSLDVTIQRQYLELLKDLQRRHGIAIIFITHDLGIVAKMCDSVAVMYAGRIVEYRSVRGLFYDPKHPYTRALLDAMPTLDHEEPPYAIPGQPPDLTALPSGCSFHPRCSRAFAPCGAQEPKSISIGEYESVSCHLYDRELQHGG